MQAAAYWLIENHWQWDCQRQAWHNTDDGEIAGSIDLMERYAEDMVLQEYAHAKAIKLAGGPGLLIED